MEVRNVDEIAKDREERKKYVIMAMSLKDPYIMIYVYMYIYNNLVTNTETIFVKKN
jgi:hypothetical protein